MNEDNTVEMLAWVTLSALVVILAAVLAWHVTPWALLMLLFLPNYSSGETVTVERGDTTVTVEKKELNEDDIERAVEQAIERARARTRGGYGHMDGSAER